jgi:chorismate synthase
LKYGLKATSGGGRSSARETIGRVAGGAIAELYLRRALGVEIVALVSGVGRVELSQEDVQGLLEMGVSREQVDADPIRCPVKSVASKMTEVS